MLKALLESLVNSQNEVNTISQVISTSERIYSNGKENYENAEKEIPDAEKALTDASSEWNKAKDMMDELSRAQSALDAAKEKLLNASTEAERIAAQAELDAERRRWQELMDKVLAYSEKEIAAAQKLGDKALEKQWTECHDHLKTDNTEMSKALDSMSDNMEKYFNDLNADGSKNEDYKRAAQVNDATYIEYSADAKLALEKMKALESALVADAQHLLDEAKRLLAIAEGDLSMSLDQAKKALDAAAKAAQNAHELYEQAKGTPYEEQAKQLLDTANSIVEKALRNVQTVEEYLRKKGLGEDMTDDEFADKRLKEAEEYLRALGYKSCVEWNNQASDFITESVDTLRNKHLKDDAWYKVVGRKGDGTLFLADDIRFYKFVRENQILYEGDQTVSKATGYTWSDNSGNSGSYICYNSVHVITSGTITYTIVEINGEPFLTGMQYSNISCQKKATSIWVAGGYNAEQYKSDISYLASPGIFTESGTYPFFVKAKIFAKSLVGY